MGIIDGITKAVDVLIEDGLVEILPFMICQMYWIDL
jgi:hypothetical protein